MAHMHCTHPLDLSGSYERDRKYVLAVLRRRCRWLADDERESILHDAYVVLLERCRGEGLEFASEAHVRAFLTRTALHKALDQRKSARWRLSVSLDQEPDIPAEGELSPERRVMLREALDQIERAIADQPVRRRGVLALRLLAGRTPEEVQDCLGISGRVYRREFERGRRALSRSLTGELGTLGAH